MSDATGITAGGISDLMFVGPVSAGAQSCNTTDPGESTCRRNQLTGPTNSSVSDDRSRLHIHYGWDTVPVQVSLAISLGREHSDSP